MNHCVGNKSDRAFCEINMRGKFLASDVTNPYKVSTVLVERFWKVNVFFSLSWYVFTANTLFQEQDQRTLSFLET